jgi:indole-3-glycerol phosphate synthase
LSKRAEAYARGGARAISVLTEEDHFQGSPEDLRAVAGSGLPRLRKDFLLDEAMVLESVSMGADAVLLMACCLPGEQLRELREVARRAGLVVLLEIHDEAELERALAVEPDCLGVNARDLRTFEVDLPKALQLIRRVATMESHPLLVAESGILGPEQLQQAADAGADAVLIGESLMREEAPDRALAEWLEVLRDR